MSTTHRTERISHDGTCCVVRLLDVYEGADGSVRIAVHVYGSGVRGMEAGLWLDRDEAVKVHAELGRLLDTAPAPVDAAPVDRLGSHPEAMPSSETMAKVAGGGE